MQTQSIMPSVPNVSSTGSGTSAKGSTKVASKDFSKVMKDNALQTGNQSQEKNQKLGNDVSTKCDKELPLKQPNGVLNVRDVQKAVDNGEMPELTKAGQDVINFLKDSFGMTEEELTDIMNQFGIQLINLIQQVLPQQDASNANQGLPNDLQDFIMQLHGVEESSSFLTSQTLENEMVDLTKGIQDILTEDFNMSLDDVKKVLDEIVATSDETPIFQLKNPEAPKMDEAIALEQPEENKQAGSQENPVTVVSEPTNTAGESNKDAGNESNNTFSFSTESERPKENSKEHVVTNNMQEFTQKLTQAFEKVEGSQEIIGKNMVDIVKQVVNQVKVRVLPETTNMEMTLHPDSLGKVNLLVAAKEGTVTANITVETQVAKEALESQLIVLKENLAQKGLRVDTVEVNVSDFSFQKEKDEQSHQENRKNRNRHFRVEDDFDLSDQEEGSMIEATTDENGAINYTA